MKRIILAACAVAMLVGACGDDDGTVSDAEIEGVLVENGVPEDLASCITGKIEGDIDVQAIEDGDAEATQELSQASADCALEAIESGESTPEELQDLGEELTE